MPQIISQDTTWTAGQVINLNEEVQIAHGATLTIEDGVVVNGNGNAIRAFGALVALDQNLNDVVFDDVQFLFGNQFDTPGSIRIEDAQILGGQFLPPTGNASYGAFSVSNSVLREVTGFYIWYPTSDSSFTNNLFDGSQGLSIGINEGVTLTVENNTFIDSLPPLGGSSTVMVWANYGELQDISIVGNNFLDGLQTHLELQDGYDSSKLYSSGNYFQGFTSADAEGAVLDSQDSLTRASDIVLENPRSSPNPAAPSVSIEPEPPVKGELISGNELPNRLSSTSGNDTIDGGLGADTAVYSGNQNSYSLTLSSTGTTIEDRRPDGNGKDTLISIEFLDFDTDLLGEPFTLQNFGGAAGLNAQDFESFIEFYIAYFNRAPDAVGLNFWGTAFANGVTLEEMADMFMSQSETYAIFPSGTTNVDIATTVYLNVLGRIPDQAGFDFWVDMLNRMEETGVTRDQFILEVLRGVQDGSPDKAYLVV